MSLKAASKRRPTTIPKLRAYVNRSSAEAAELRFTCLGPTRAVTALGSGEARRQFGFKLHAADACNLVYELWRIESQSRLVVSVKRNSGQHTSAECGSRGYYNVKPRHSAPIAPLAPRQAHRPRASIEGAELVAAINVKGPAGVRSDNARWLFELVVDAPRASSDDAPACSSGARDSD